VEDSIAIRLEIIMNDLLFESSDLLSLFATPLWEMQLPARRYEPTTPGHEFTFVVKQHPGALPRGGSGGDDGWRCTRRAVIRLPRPGRHGRGQGAISAYR
jgi:hypothetical protein